MISTKGLTAELTNKNNGAKYFSIDRLQNHLVFITFSKCAFISGTSKNSISSWKFTALSEGKIINPYESNTNFFLKVKGFCIF